MEGNDRKQHNGQHGPIQWNAHKIRTVDLKPVESQVYSSADFFQHLQTEDEPQKKIDKSYEILPQSSTEFPLMYLISQISTSFPRS